MATAPAPTPAPGLTMQQTADLANKAAYYSLMKIVGQSAEVIVLAKTADRAKNYANTLSSLLDRRLTVTPIWETEANKINNIRGKTVALVSKLDTLNLTADATAALNTALTRVATLCSANGFTTTASGLIVVSK